MSDWSGSFEHARKSAAGSDDSLANALIDELYVRIFERKPSETERAENLRLLEFFTDKLKRQQALGKLIESWY